MRSRARNASTRTSRVDALGGEDPQTGGLRDSCPSATNRWG